MSYTTGNADRDRYIDVAISKCERRGQPTDLATVAARLPAEFELDATELAGIKSNREATPEPVEVPSAELASDPVTGRTLSLRQTRPPAKVSMPVEEEPPSKSLENFEAPRENGAAPSTIDTAESIPGREITHAMAVESVQRAQAKLAEDRITVRSATERVKAARGELFAAVQAFQSGDGMTAEERRMAAVRDYVNASTAARAERAARYGTGVSEKANAFARRQTAVPPGIDPNTLRKGSSRGAAPASYRGRRAAGNPMIAPRGAVPIKTGA